VRAYGRGDLSRTTRMGPTRALAKSLKVRETVEPIRLVLLDEDQPRGLALISALRRAIPSLVGVVISPRPQARPLAPRVIDVLLVNIGERPGESLAEAIFHCSSRPWLAPLFCFDERTASPELDVVLDLGVGRVLPIQTLRRWLTRALVPLGRAAHHRRELMAAEARIPPAPALDAASATALTLPKAEQRFREAYLRALLSQSASQKDAASRAGVPYTTLCSMLKKLSLGQTR